MSDSSRKSSDGPHCPFVAGGTVLRAEVPTIIEQAQDRDRKATEWLTGAMASPRRPEHAAHRASRMKYPKAFDSSLLADTERAGRPGTHGEIP
ncbi:MAG: hypothetical protein JJU36_04045 [Phycisphaeraceae bacterium]|nr:hypothetical protein [Phycisphaeraceae bacterium]